MSLQNKDIDRSQIENNILDLELKYFKIIIEILKSEDFANDLQRIEKEISDNYAKFDDLWNLKNKIKIPAERVVRHYLYIKMKDLITGIFPSPLSSDFGVRTKDAVVCVDIKTIDTDNNAGDLKATSVEKNQTSFDNRNYPFISIPHNMNDFDDYSRLPILTYVVKIVYTDNKVFFKLCRDPEWFTIALVSIPNGRLSRLFSYDIMENCKTYEYYTEKDDPRFKPIMLASAEVADSDALDKICRDHGLQRYNIGNKVAYIDQTKIIWWKTSIKNKVCIAPVKGGSNIRFRNETLEKRFDSKNNPWSGYEKWTIADNPFMIDQHKS